MQTERRISSLLQCYWQQLTLRHKKPLESDILPSVIQPVWDDCFLIRIMTESGSAKYYLEYLGSTIMKALQENSGLLFLEKTFFSSKGFVLEHVRRAHERQEIIFEENGMIADKTGVNILYRLCAFPVSSHEHNASFIFGGVRFTLK